MHAHDTPDVLWPVHIEVRVVPTASIRLDTIRTTVHSFITSSYETLVLPTLIDGWESLPMLESTVMLIRACESPCPTMPLPIAHAALQVHVYQATEADGFEEFTTGEAGGESEDVLAASVLELPSSLLDGLWDNLIFRDDTKQKLLDYIYATLLFSDADVNFNVVSWNRVVLLHGPPGTGKTSLCRALAQKLSIRLSHRYPQARLLEINSHSLFSRWFSESGKLVQRLFSSVMELVEDEDTFIVVLIDEIESLTAARAGAMAGTEPSDALRVVNALLTQLDKLRFKKNVLVVSTSNLAKAIGSHSSRLQAGYSAFVDRADIVQYIDLPPREAIYEILRSCLQELMVKGVVGEVELSSLDEAIRYERTALSSAVAAAPSSLSSRERTKQTAVRMLGLAQRCRDLDMSGRALRRLPVLAHARYIGLAFTPQASSISNVQKAGGMAVRVETWLGAMERVLDGHAGELGRLEK
ncbi:P-loop containing nucleoside triphosphate hydrolase protein [Vararia minispora EC-137]|uniref:P-loop containing nucleoside triphosphate hydrolase protein n=1 Tax=Vararia minispora EC-137 TaxID=1314806 RepID=A0ACB8QEH3_9AGAM|nr:P-loop containing nucleoside triphosphate hydrolase protein [Vararia minispora EC-137]